MIKEIAIVHATWSVETFSFEFELMNSLKTQATGEEEFLRNFAFLKFFALSRGSESDAENRTVSISLKKTTDANVDFWVGDNFREGKVERKFCGNKAQEIKKEKC